MGDHSAWWVDDHSAWVGKWAEYHFKVYLITVWIIDTLVKRQADIKHKLPREDHPDHYPLGVYRQN